MDSASATMPPQTPYVSANFIRNKSSPSQITNDYIGFSDAEHNNTAAVRVFVRLTNDPKNRQFEINRRVAPRLLLTRHKKYQFNIDLGHGETTFAFYDLNKRPLTTPSYYTVMGFQANGATPTEFYYGSADGVGGLHPVVIVG